MNQKGFSPIVVVVSILILLVFIIVIYLNNRSTVTPQQPPQPSDLNTVNDQNKTTKPLLKEVDFNPTKKIGNVAYPQEIQQLQKEDLQIISCIQNKEPVVKDLENEQLNSLKDQIRVQEGLFIGNFLYCETQNSNKFVEYGIAANDGDVNNMSANIALVDESLKLNEVVTIPKIDAWYNRCTTPIALTKNGTLYLQCGSGDAGSVWFSIYKIDMTNKLSLKIIECNSHDEGKNYTC